MIVSSAGTWVRSASKARSSTGRPLRSTAWPTNTIRSGSFGRAHRRGGHAALRQRDAVRHDPVVAAVEAPAGPGGGLGDREAQVEVVELAARAEQRGDLVRRDRLRVAVEGADERRVDAGERVPADDRGDRLVQVHDVGVEGAQLAAQRRDRGAASGRGSRQRRSTASRSCRRAAPANRRLRAAAGARRGAGTRPCGCRGRTARTRARRGRSPAAPPRAPRCGASRRRGRSTNTAIRGLPACAGMLRTSLDCLGSGSPRPGVRRTGCQYRDTAAILRFPGLVKNCCPAWAAPFISFVKRCLNATSSSTRS